MLHNLGALVGHAVNSPKTYPKTAAGAFPKLFGNEGREKGISVYDWEVSKANMTEYAKIHNSRKGGGK